MEIKFSTVFVHVRQYRVLLMNEFKGAMFCPPTFFKN